MTTESRRLPGSLPLKAVSGWRWLCLVLVLALSACGGSSEATATSTPTGSATLARTATITNTPRPTRTFTATATLTPTVSRTPRPTRTFTPAPSATYTASPVGSLTPTPLLSSSGPFSTVLSLERIAPGIIQQLFLLDSQTVLLAGTFGLARVNLDSLETRTASFFDQVLGIDAAGKAWLLPRGGAKITAWDGSRFEEYGYQQGWLLPARLPATPGFKIRLLPGPDSSTWLATAVDIRRFDGRRWRVFTATESGVQLPYKAGVETAFALAIDPASGDAWAASCNWQGSTPLSGGGLRRFDGQRWRATGFPDSTACITAIQVDDQGRVWVAAGNRLWHLDPTSGDWSTLDLPDLANLDRQYLYFEDLVLSPGGDLWPLVTVTDGSGYVRERIRFRYDGSDLVETRRLPAPATQQLFFTRGEEVWALEPGQIYRFRDGNTWDLLANLEVRTVAQDDQSAVWLVTSVRDMPLLWKASP